MPTVIRARVKVVVPGKRSAGRRRSYNQWQLLHLAISFVLTSLWLIFLIQGFVSGQTEYLRWLTAAVLPLFIPAIGHHLGAKKAAATRPSPKSLNYVEDLRSMPGSFPVPGPGVDGWLTERGCLLEDCRLFRWSAMDGYRVAEDEPGFKLITLLLRQDQGKRLRFLAISLLLTTLLSAGAVWGLWVAGTGLALYGGRPDVLALVLFDLCVVYTCCLAAVYLFQRHPKVQTRLEAVINCQRTDLAELEQLLEAHLPGKGVPATEGATAARG